MSNLRTLGVSLKRAKHDTTFTDPVSGKLVSFRPQYLERERDGETLWIQLQQFNQSRRIEMATLHDICDALKINPYDVVFLHRPEMYDE